VSGGAGGAETGAPAVIVRLSGEPQDIARSLGPLAATVPLEGATELFARAARRDRSLSGKDLAVVGEPPRSGIGASVVTLAAGLLRPRAVVEVDTRDSTGVRRPLSRYLAGSLLRAGGQLACSAAGVGIQGALAQTRRSPDGTGSATSELARVTYLRPVAGIPARVGGSVTHAHGVIKALHELDIAVEPLTTDAYIAETAAADPALGFAWTVVPVPDRWKALPASAAFGGDLALLRASTQAARWSQIVYQRHNRYSLVGALLAARTRRPLFLEYNGPEAFFDQTWHANPLARQLERCEEASLRSAARIIVNSKVDHGSLLERGIPARRLVLSPNGVEVERFDMGGGEDVRGRLGVDRAEILVGFVGSFGPWHGAPTLARAFLRLLPAGGRIRLLLVGDGPERKAVEALLADGGAIDDAILTGSVPPYEIPAHLDACDILASPHVPLPGEVEFFGSPTKLFEYMAAGKAIVASDLAQIGEVLEHERTALLTPPGDVPALAAAISQLSGDGVLRHRLGTAARQTAVRRHSWRRNAEQIAEAFADWRAQGADDA
jgi:glycosyltransferase involved in cell wall biosynthesis